MHSVASRAHASKSSSRPSVKSTARQSSVNRNAASSAMASGKAASKIALSDKTNGPRKDQSVARAAVTSKSHMPAEGKVLEPRPASSTKLPASGMAASNNQVREEAACPLPCFCPAFHSHSKQSVAVVLA